MWEDIPLLGRWIALGFQKYWRLVRGSCLSVEACVIDDAGNALMVQNESGSSWDLPRGAVHNAEILETALRRILHDVAIEVNGKPELSCFYATGKCEQTGVYLVRRWQPLGGSTAARTRFFPIGSLPEGINSKAGERIRRLTGARTISQVC